MQIEPEQDDLAKLVKTDNDIEVMGQSIEIKW